MPKYTRRLTAETAKKLGLQPAVRTAPAPKKTLKQPCGSFEQEYQDFIAKLKAVVETKVEEPVVETATEEAPVDIAEEPVVEEKPKKTRKKKAEVVDEAPVQETTTEE